MAEQTEVKVIGAGWGRTGTMSFKTAMEILGMKCYHMIEVFKNDDADFWRRLAENDPTADLHEVLGARGFEATSDFPSSAFVEEQMKRYPNAKVILTYRDPEKWYRSCCDTIFQAQADYEGCGFGTRVFLGLRGSFPFMVTIYFGILLVLSLDCLLFHRFFRITFCLFVCFVFVDYESNW